MRIGLSPLLMLAFGGAVALSVGAVLATAVIKTGQQTGDLLGERLKSLVIETETAAGHYFGTVEVFANWLGERARRPEALRGSDDTLRAVLQGGLAALPQVREVYYRDPEGGSKVFVRETARMVPADAGRQGNGTENGLEGGAAWQVGRAPVSGAVSAVYRIRLPGRSGADAVLAFYVDVQPLSQQLARNAVYEGYSIYRFILFDRTRVVAHPLLVGDQDGAMPTVEELGDEVIRRAVAGDAFRPEILPAIEGGESWIVRIRDEDYALGMRAAFSGAVDGEILVGAYVSEDAGRGAFQNLFELLVGGAMLVGSVLVAVLLARRAARPIQGFAEAARKVRDNRLDEVAPLRATNVRELDDAADAFNGMIEGLRERQRIRELFGRYVPEHVARLLLSDEHAGEPRTTEGTVLFLDLAGFTRMAEQLPPEDVITTLNAFFSDAVAVIEARNGVVTQFQGDAILAVFNAPVADPDHARHAVEAALALAASCRDNRYGGRRLSCRIGVNTGAFVAGAVGAKGRLSYTVHGDAVNVASRLESLNKEKGTTILIAESTVAQAPVCSFREVGELPIRGRKGAVRVFTPEGPTPA